MENLLERILDTFENINDQATPAIETADDRFNACLDRIFPSFRTKDGSNVGPCDDIKATISSEAFHLVSVYCHETAMRSLRLGAQLMLEMLEEGDAAC